MVRNQKIKKLRSIRSDLFLLIVLIAMVPLSIYFFFDIFALRRELKWDVHSNFSEIAEYFGGELDAFLADRLIDLKLLSQNPVIKSAYSSPKDKLQEMNKVQEYYHYFDDITLMSPDGSAILSTTYSYVPDMSKTSWFLDASKGNTVITDPYYDASGTQLLISIFLPIYEENRIISVLSAQMQMEKIWKKSDAVRFGEFGYIMVLDRFGTILAHPDRNMIFKKLKEVADKNIQPGEDASFPVDFTDENGTEFVGSLVSMEKNPAYHMSPLLILVSQDRNEAYALSNYVLIRDLLEMIAVLSLITLVSLYVSAKMVRPIEAIIEGSKRISEGKLGITIAVDSWQEINSIAEAINMMSLGLLEYTKQLKDSEERYRTLVENIDNGFFLLQDYILIYVNDAALRITGYMRNEIIGKDFRDFFIPDLKDRLDEYYREAQENINSENKYEIPYIRKDGQKIFLEVRGKISMMGGDKVLAGIFVDISDRKRHEELLNESREVLEWEVKRKNRELFESEQKFRTIFETAADGIVLCEVDGIVISANQAAVNILGFTLVGTESNHFLKIITDGIDKKEADHIKKDILYNQESVSVNTFIRNKNRGVVNLEIKMSPLFMMEGKRHIQSIIRDTTDRKILEKALVDSKQRLQAAFDAVSDRMYIVDSSYVLKFVNEHIANEIGRNYRYILNKPCYSFLNTKNEPCDGCPLKQAARDEHGSTGEVTIIHSDRNRFFHVSVYPVLSGGSQQEFLVHSRDVTEEKKIQEHLIQSDRLISLGQLSAGVAHEINNPLTSILGYSQMLLANRDQESQDYGDLKVIERQAMNCKVILDDLLLFSRLRVDKKEFFSINEVLDGALLINNKEIKDKQIAVKKRYQKNLPVFFGDQVRITQVFLNIVKNAVDAVNAEGHITITTNYNPAEKMIRSSISDDGSGIEEKNLNKIFDPFFTTKPPGKGTGLGLSVSYGIVVEHGGNIRVESKPLKGTEFTVNLPSSPDSKESL